MLDRSTLAAGFDQIRPGLAYEIATSRLYLFSDIVVPVKRADWQAMGELVTVIERLAASSDWQAQALLDAPASAQSQPHGHGVFFGYDFHLTADGPQLIEINSNAGGALLNVLLLQAWGRNEEVRQAEEAIANMLLAEWRAARGERPLKTIALVDETPTEQYLYPEFLLFQALMRRQGLECLICDPRDLLLCHGRLWLEETPIDLVYNRLTDFYFAEPMNAVLRQACIDGSAVITPPPQAHALLADKRHLARLSDPERLANLDPATRDLLLACVPRTEIVPPDMDEAAREALWARRKTLFFKPVAGFGARGAYRGEGLTRRVFSEILQGGYVAQALATPATMPVIVEGQAQALKYDLRLYTYRGEVLLGCARLWQGQTTNFRTPGGGFAPLVLVD